MARPRKLTDAEYRAAKFRYHVLYNRAANRAKQDLVEMYPEDYKILLALHREEVEKEGLNDDRDKEKKQ